MSLRKLRKLIKLLPHKDLRRGLRFGVAGEADINISNSPDSSSLLPISDLQTQHFPGTQRAASTTLQVKRLDSCIAGAELGKNSLLKIDVQGFELELLKGATELLPHIQAVYVECSFIELYQGQALASAVIDFLHEHGFTLAGFYNPQYDPSGAAIQADLAFNRG